MKFSRLAEYFEKIEATASRLEMTKLIADLFGELKAAEIPQAVYLMQGRVAPIYDAVEFGMAEKMVAKAIIDALHIEKSMLDSHFRKSGDLGKTVVDLKAQMPSLETRDSSIEHVFQELERIAGATGDGSQSVKIGILAGLIRELDPRSCKYLVRIPTGTMRLGFSDMTILDALSWMLTGGKSLRPEIQRAYHVRPDLGYVGSLLKEKGIDSLKNVQPRIFTPILMMRAERLSSSSEIIEKIGKCIIESKYDGFRLQIHYKKNKAKLYSRNLEEVSYMYPDIVAGVKAEVKAEEMIFEGEAIGFDEQTGSFLPFQETVQRKRKYGIEEKAKEIPLKLFAFELLYADGVNYVQSPFVDRRRQLMKHLKLTGDIFKDTIMLAPEETVETPEKIELLFDDAVSRGLEGIVAKKMDGTYQPGARGWNWIKFKRSYSSKIDDTIDCVVMGYDYGRGKRSGFGLGAFLVGVYDAEKDLFTTVAKIGTGLSDEEWKALYVRCEKLKTEKIPSAYEVDKLMQCDVWVKPSIVVEIKADELSRSPVHTAGRIMKPSKSGSAFDVDVPGYALRFPRLKTFRDDRRAEDATTLEEVAKMFAAQRK